MALLLASALIAGILVGSVGIGGVLLVPASMVFSRLEIHEAAATALFTSSSRSCQVRGFTPDGHACAAAASPCRRRDPVHRVLDCRPGKGFGRLTAGRHDAGGE